MFAVWFLFEKNDNEYLLKIIKELAESFDCPIFIPHITIHGLVNHDITKLEKIIFENIDELSPFFVQKNGINYSKNIWKTLFIDIKLNSSLEILNSNLNKKLLNSNLDFQPHVSLMYKKIPDFKKIEIIKKLNIKNSFLITEIGILKYSDNINEWKIIKKFSL